MHIGVWDLVLIYGLPLVLAGIFLGVFLVLLYLVVKYDIFRLDFSYDMLMGLKYRKRLLSLSNVSFLVLFDNGMQATLLYRISRTLYLHKMVPLALVISKIAKTLTNIDVSPTARIGRGISLWHGTSITIAQFAEIGERCVVRQGCGVSGFGKVRVGDDVSFAP
jgi:serine acetyltransferase